MRCDHPSRFVTRCFTRPEIELSAERFRLLVRQPFQVPWDELVERRLEGLEGPHYDLRSSYERLQLRRARIRASLDASTAFRLAHRGRMGAYEATRWEDDDDRYYAQLEDLPFLAALPLELAAWSGRDAGVDLVLPFDDYLGISLHWELHLCCRDRFDDLDIAAVQSFLAARSEPSPSPRALLRTIEEGLSESVLAQGWRLGRSVCFLEAYQRICQHLNALPEQCLLGARWRDPQRPDPPSPALTAAPAED
jgi:hypothetical protein